MPRRRRQVDPLVAALRARRHNLGLSQADVVALMGGRGRGHVSRVETGARSPMLATLRAWCEALDVDLVVAPRSEPPTITDADVGLTPTEARGRRREVARLTVAGLSGRRIAQRLGVSRRTVVRDRKGGG